MKAIKTFVFLIIAAFMLCLLKIIGVFVFDMASLMVPSGKSGIDDVNDGLKEGAEWFEKRSGMTPAEKQKAYNDAGLFYNPETGEWEEDPEKYSRYLNAKTGYNPDR